MSFRPRRIRRWLVASAATLLLFEVTPALERVAEGTPAAWVVRAVGIGEADAQTTWGMSRRTSRRTSRRVTRRRTGTGYLYNLPPGYQTTYAGATPIYIVEGVEYEPQMIEGQVVYVPR